MERNSEMEMELNDTTIGNSCNWRCSIKVELATMRLGLLSYRRGCMSKSSIFSYILKAVQIDR